MTAVLVVGVPRSGTSWVGRVLGSTAGAAYIGEPDNHEHVAFALRAKLGLPGRLYPRVAAAAELPEYERLWRAALEEPGDGTVLERVRRRAAHRLLRRASSGELLRAIARPADSGPFLKLAARLAVPERAPRAESLVVKSVHAQLALEWLAGRFPLRVLLVLRQPLNVLSSWKAMGWLDAPGVLDELGADVAAELERELGLDPLEPHGPVEEAAQLIALLTAVLRDGAGRHDDWPVAWHESLCAQPHELFPPLAEAVGLAWDGRADRLLDELNRPGEGYETARVASSLTEVWRSRLTPEEVRVASRFFDRLAEPWPAGR